jgi:2-C-methyl-D-erythritol 4-phosphate cytidylyltransferase
MKKNIAIILAGGIGKRIGGESPKQFQLINNRMVIDYSIQVFLNHESIDDIIIVSHENWIDSLRESYPHINIIKGGETRMESSYNGLKSCPLDTFNVLIHDGARPFIPNGVIQRSIDLLQKYEAINLAIPASDTVVIAKNTLIDTILDRKQIFLSQTPQSFRYQAIFKAHKLSKQKDASDDIQVAKELGIECYNLEGSKSNIKITFPEDINMANNILIRSNDTYK